ncbi:unnamed protein product, partial [Ectocarpus sp. 12 AP-2014]
RATQGAHWTTNTGWGTSAEIGRWHGVTVDEQDRVTQIDLNENNLQGAIPGEVGNLQSLVCLSLDHNNLSGESKFYVGLCGNWSPFRPGRGSSCV